MQQVVLASHNRKKLAELQALLQPLGWSARTVAEFSAAVPEETAPSFVENALLKARHAAQVSGLPAIADDSGLEVDALKGAPGVYSARYAGAAASDADNNRKLLDALHDVPAAQRGARFIAALVFLRHADDPVPLIAVGAWRGRILEVSQGGHGFGYDPLFYVPEQGCSAAELDAALKNRISHRAQAMARLLELLRG
ncbi:MAG: xanthosine triphosphate pyrophosphatase [Nevskia sp.]|nr:xanthosine triphosphate pyrophosphatase [Nevskia sp.]